MAENINSISIAMIGRGRGRGVLKNNSFQPVRRPGTTAALACTDKVNQPEGGSTSAQAKIGPFSPPASGNSTFQNSTVKHSDGTSVRRTCKISETQDNVKVVKLIAKYSYKANPDEPGGFKELTIKQAQRLTLVNKHQTNNLWWNVQDEEGNRGHVPASYVKVLEDKPTTLPWLQNKGEEDVNTKKTTNVFGVPEKSAFVPYKSAYSKTGDVVKTSQKYYCDVCEKSFNGPKPYSSHMASRGHREEVELAAERS
ncbi:uncharacterized protein [Ptychodera flava]|uniref:uncharacterized protein n=1 Tax=Ptychodera flava TaxID=63121 RepID=UPI00396A42B1